MRVVQKRKLSQNLLRFAGETSKKRGAKNKSPKAKETENGNRTDQKTTTQNHAKQTPSTSPEKQNRWGLGREEGKTGGKASSTRDCGQNARCSKLCVL
jgi:hypothetical protein